MKFLHGFAGGCPPAPNFARARGISDCEWVQLSSRQKRELKNMRHNPAEIHVNQMYLPTRQQLRSNPSCHPEHVGRSFLFGPRDNGTQWDMPRILRNYNTIKNREGGLGRNYRVAFQGVEGTYSEQIAKLIWAMQVYALWLTDGNAFTGTGDATALSNRGIVTRNGHNPSDVSTLNPDMAGIPATDLRFILRNGGSREGDIYGTDGIFGRQAEQMLINYANSGTLMGENVQSGDKAFIGQRVMTPLLNAISTDRIDAAKARPSGVAERTVTETLTCESMNREQRRAAGFTEDCRPLTGAAAPARGPSIPRRFFNIPDATSIRLPTRDLDYSGVLDYDFSPTPPPPPPPPPPSDEARSGSADDDDTLLYVGIALAMVAAGGGYVYYRNKKRRTAPTRPAIR